MKEIPEACPVRDILSQVKSVLELLHKILEHCDKCMKEEGKQDAKQ